MMGLGLKILLQYEDSDPLLVDMKPLSFSSLFKGYWKMVEYDLET